MSRKVVSIVGATGIQGGSVVDALIPNEYYKTRALTRNPSSDAAKSLTARGVEVVSADINDVSKLTAAVQGSSAIYTMTNFGETYSSTRSTEEAIEIEAQQGII